LPTRSLAWLPQSTSLRERNPPIPPRQLDVVADSPEPDANQKRLEKNRMQFFHELMGFLDEDRPPALK
jgi:hypothetical protein